VCDSGRCDAAMNRAVVTCQSDSVDSDDIFAGRHNDLKDF